MCSSDLVHKNPQSDGSQVGAVQREAGASALLYLHFSVQPFSTIKKNVRYIKFMNVEHESRSVVSDSLQPHGLYSPWNSPGQKTGVGSCSLLQGIFPIRGLNPGLLHCRRTFYHPEPPEKPRGHLWEIIILPALRSLYKICSV